MRYIGRICFCKRKHILPFAQYKTFSEKRVAFFRESIYNKCIYAKMQMKKRGNDNA